MISYFILCMLVYRILFTIVSNKILFCFKAIRNLLRKDVDRKNIILYRCILRYANYGIDVTQQ